MARSFQTGNLLSREKRIGHRRNIIREIMYPFVFGIGVFLFLAVIYHGATRRIPDIKISLIAYPIISGIQPLFVFSLLVSGNWMATNYPFIISIRADVALAFICW